MVYSTWQIPVFGVTWRNNHITTWCPSPARRSDDMKCISCYVYIYYIIYILYIIYYIYILWICFSWFWTCSHVRSCPFYEWHSQRGRHSQRGMIKLTAPKNLIGAMIDDTNHSNHSQKHGSVSKPCTHCTPVVHIKIAGIYGCEYPPKNGQVLIHSHIKNLQKSRVHVHGIPWVSCDTSKWWGCFIPSTGQNPMQCGIFWGPERAKISAVPHFFSFSPSSDSFGEFSDRSEFKRGNFTHFYTQHTFLWWLHNPRRSKGL